MIRTSQHDDVLVVTIDAPPVNALPPDGWRALREEFTAASTDTEVRAVVLQGTPGRFCAGADIQGLASAAQPSADALTVVSHAAAAIRTARPPVIAAIDGPAHGGGLELALACDIRLASPSATFVAAGVNMGLVASVPSLITAIGDARARAMLLTATRIDSDRAEAWGLVTSVSDTVHDDALEMARRIAGKPPLAVEATKALANDSHRLPEDELTEIMAARFTQLAGSSDHAEALEAFLDKRPGRFRRA